MNAISPENHWGSCGLLRDDDARTSCTAAERRRLDARRSRDVGGDGDRAAATAEAGEEMPPRRAADPTYTITTVRGAEQSGCALGHAYRSSLEKRATWECARGPRTKRHAGTVGVVAQRELWPSGPIPPARSSARQVDFFSVVDDRRVRRGHRATVREVAHSSTICCVSSGVTTGRVGALAIAAPGDVVHFESGAAASARNTAPRRG
jgi:hypothetical protein